MNTLKNKIVWIGMAMLMIVTLVLAVLAPNAAILTMSDEAKYAMTYQEFTDADYATDANDVKFLAFFAQKGDDALANKYAGTTKAIGDTANLYMDLSVSGDGYLEGGTITLGESNFKLGMNAYKGNMLSQTISSEDVKNIYLNRLQGGTAGILKGVIKNRNFPLSSESKIVEPEIVGTHTTYISASLEDYSKITKVTLTGTYVTTDGENNVIRTPINKVVDLTVDWHGYTGTKIYANSGKHIAQFDANDNFVNKPITFSFSTEEWKKELVLKSTTVSVEIPKLQGYAPISVTGIGTKAGVYDEATRTLTFFNEVEVDENSYILAVVANKSDLVDDEAVSEEDGKKFAEKKKQYLNWFQQKKTQKE